MGAGWDLVSGNGEALGSSTHPAASQAPASQVPSPHLRLLGLCCRLGQGRLVRRLRISQLVRGLQGDGRRAGQGRCAVELLPFSQHVHILQLQLLLLLP